MLCLVYTHQKLDICTATCSWIFYERMDSDWTKRQSCYRCDQGALRASCNPPKSGLALRAFCELLADSDHRGLDKPVKQPGCQQQQRERPGGCQPDIVRQLFEWLCDED